jgi:hypothetical protein
MNEDDEMMDAEAVDDGCHHHNDHTEDTWHVLVDYLHSSTHRVEGVVEEGMHQGDELMMASCASSAQRPWTLIFPTLLQCHHDDDDDLL